MSEFQEVSCETGGSVPTSKPQPRTGGSSWFMCTKCGDYRPAVVWDEEHEKWIGNEEHKCQY
jgi:hypothetical protein